MSGRVPRSLCDDNSSASVESGNMKPIDIRELRDLQLRLGDLKLADLQGECAKFGIDKTGKKELLIDKLKTVIDKGLINNDNRVSMNTSTHASECEQLRREMAALKEHLSDKERLLEERGYRIRDLEELNSLLREKLASKQPKQACKGQPKPDAVSNIYTARNNNTTASPAISNSSQVVSSAIPTNASSYRDAALRTGSHTGSPTEHSREHAIQIPKGDATEYVNNENNFSTITRKPRKLVKTKPIIGTNNQDCKISAAPKKIWVHVGRVAKETSVSDITEYLQDKIVNGDFTCEKLASRGDYSSFKVGTDSGLLATLNDPDFWPSGVSVRRFFLRFTRPESAT